MASWDLIVVGGANTDFVARSDELPRRGESLNGDAVAVAAGGEGNLLVWRDGERWFPRVSVQAVDATGAGDAFAATLAVWLSRGRPLAEAGRFASFAAAFATTRLGAQSALAREEELHQLAARYPDL